MAEYNVVLLDEDGFETVNDVVDGLPAAKKRAQYLLSPAFADSVGSTHEALGSVKVEVRDAAGECRWDAFLKRTPSPAEEPEDDADEEPSGCRM